VGLPSSLICVVLVIYLLLAPRPSSDRAQVAASRYFVFVSLAFPAIWFWTSLTFALVLWLFILGDRHHWLHDHGSKVTGLFALAVCTVAFLRGMTGNASHLYVRVLAWVPPFLLLAAAAVCVDRQLNLIEGFTAESAAQNIFESAAYHRRDGMRLVPHTGPPVHPDTPAEHRTFWVVEGDKKVALLVVWRKGFGWRLLRIHWFSKGDSRDILIDAKVYLDQSDEAKARYCLEQVIANFPGTPAETEARELLKRTGFLCSRHVADSSATVKRPAQQKTPRSLLSCEGLGS